MPNWVDNWLQVNGPDASTVVEFVRSDKNAFDFDKVTPMPAELHGSEASTDVDWGLLMLGIEYDKGSRDVSATSALNYQWIKAAGVTDEAGLRELLRRDPRAAEYEAAGRKAGELIAATGYANWYDWRIEHWGTKWDAIEAGGGMDANGDARFSFRTAWDPPFPIIAKLSAMFPSSTFRLRYIDEADDRERFVVFKLGCVTEHGMSDADGEPQLPAWSDVRAEVEQAADGDASSRG